MGDCATFHVILLSDIMDLQMSMLGTLVPERPCYVFHIHAHKYSQHIQQPID